MGYFTAPATASSFAPAIAPSNKPLTPGDVLDDELLDLFEIFHI